MIIITGPGRSGTSILAQIYKELGFDPGGEWVDEIHGGLEPTDVVAVNEEIIEALGLTPMGAPGGLKRRFRRAGKALLPAEHRARARHALRHLPWMSNRQPGMLRWERIEATVAQMRGRLHELAIRHAVAKDPRFLWTMPVWAQAGVPIDHVLISLRNLDATVKSRGRMDSIRFRTESGARNSIVYGLGLTMTAVEDHAIPYSVVRFPDFLELPDALYAALRFPAPVSETDFVATVRRVRRPELVHDER